MDDEERSSRGKAVKVFACVAAVGAVVAAVVYGRQVREAYLAATEEHGG